MEKKFSFSDNPTLSKIIYGTVVALLCISAIVIGIVAANNRKTPTPPDDTVVDDGTNNEDQNQTPPPSNNNNNNTDEKKASYIAPCVGKVIKGHSTTTPVYSTTLEEWRIHTGIDIMTEESAEVFAAEAGEVSNVYKDPLLGSSIEITHADGMKSVYKNLSADSISVKAGDKVVRGQSIAKVGDSAIMEIAEEPHLHFEMILSDKLVDPLDYIDKEAQKSSLGIVE